MVRPPPPDETSPARLIATMVGIVGMVLLGSLAWSAIGALFAALGEAAASLSPRPAPTLLPTPVVVVFATPTSASSSSVQTSTALVLAPTGAPSLVTLAPTAEAATLTPAASGRAPWILLPQPAPGTRVSPGVVVIEARGRGDAPITAIHLDLDGDALAVALERRGQTTWRGFASAQVAAGQHSVRATVVDDQGRSGSFRWTFEASP